MIDRRICIPKSHILLIDNLWEGGEGDLNGPFKTRAAVLAFAAALGASDGDPIPFSDTAGDPIRKSVFISAGYESLINILAVAFTKDPNVLSNTDEMEDRRAQIFEGYANRGLNLLSTALMGEMDHTNGIRLLILNKRNTSDFDSSELDITSLIN
jgi:dnd system-associated protein 4